MKHAETVLAGHVCVVSAHVRGAAGHCEQKEPQSINTHHHRCHPVATHRWCVFTTCCAHVCAHVHNCHVSRRGIRTSVPAGVLARTACALKTAHDSVAQWERSSSTSSKHAHAHTVDAEHKKRMACGRFKTLEVCHARHRQKVTSTHYKTTCGHVPYNTSKSAGRQTAITRSRCNLVQARVTLSGCPQHTGRSQPTLITVCTPS